MPKKEDNRDIFDKIMDDYAAPVVGGLVGSIAARKLSKRLTDKNLRRSERELRDYERIDDSVNSSPGAWRDNGTTPDISRQQVSDARRRFGKFRDGASAGKAIATVAGGAAGAAMGGAYSESKRRK